MYAVAFDMSISDLEKHYGTPYNNAYFEIATILYKYSFYRIQGSTYVTEDKIWVI
jgi:virulence-associated protein D homolog